MAAISSARPCPKGCSLSGGLLEIFVATSTIMELKESESVCQASAISAREPVTNPAQYLKMNNKPLVAIDNQP